MAITRSMGSGAPGDPSAGRAAHPRRSRADRAGPRAAKGRTHLYVDGHLARVSSRSLLTPLRQRVRSMRPIAY